MSRPERMARSGWLLPALLALGAAIAVSRGQDASWDLKNYHLYNPWAFLHGRLGWDIAAVGLQGYFNPLIDVPYFWLATGPLQDHPRLLAAWQGLTYGALIYVLVRIALRLEGGAGRSFGWTSALAVVLGVTGTMTLSQTGLTTNEVPLALLVLGGFLVTVRLVTGDTRRPLATAAMAGVLCGLAAGFKPTAIVYAPALACAVLVALRFSRQAWTIASIFALTSAVAFAVSYGSWAWALWKLTGNPIFPMFNQVFHSPWMPAVSATDRQYMPHSVAQALFYPFWWIHKNRTQGDPAFADARYAIAMIALLGALAVRMLSRHRALPAPQPAVRLLFTFVAVAYVLWLALYAILRYAVPIEALTGLVVLCAAHAAAGRVTTRKAWAARVPAIAMAIFAVVAAATTRYPDWWHAPFGRQVFDVDAGAVEPGSLVVVLSQPNAYLAPFIGHADQARFVGITWLNVNGTGYELDARAKAAIVQHRGPMYALLRDGADAEFARFGHYLPGVSLGACRPIKSGNEQTLRRHDTSDGLRICQVTRPST